MSNISPTISNTRLWRSTLATLENDQYNTERERLRSTFLSFRDRSGQLATEIRRDLPDLTIHDLSHLDALWEIATTIVGESYTLTPTEAFVLGGAILLHDLGMSVAATEGGFGKIKIDPRWADLVTFEYQNKYGRQPTIEELVEPEQKLKQRSLFNLLRQIHAENAEKLAFLSFNASDNSPIFLIEDTEIRQTFGRIIGQIAHSHWWSMTDIEKNFGRVIGAPHWCPSEWTIDPLKIACILRVADASHLDARRAPSFSKAFNNLSPASEEHWLFQEKLNKPYLGEDALVFTAGRAFRLSEASAWWLCLDTLRLADRELRSVDALFAEKGYPRFAAKRIAGTDTSERFASYIHTDGWLPINAMVHVTDLPGIIQSIGGNELYGERPQVALRELIQNACDAIRARRVYESRNSDFGRITVKLTEVNNDFWLEVADTGIGMSQRVLTDFLLDFGRSFWGSPQMQEELPGLLSSGIKPIGKYGIGFFSVFMIAEHVQVITRRSDLAARDTLVLEFSLGLGGRPILRPASKPEQLLEGGTHVKMKLKKSPYIKEGLLFLRYKKKPYTLADLCSAICPAIDTNLYTIENNNEEKVIEANDWQSMDGGDLLNRMTIKSTITSSESDSIQQYILKAASNLRNLINDNGEVVGRAFITPGFALHDDSMDYLSGVVTVGGLEACQLSGICGVLVGRPVRASRDDAMPIVSDSVLKSWAEEQADLVPELWNTPEQQSACAQYIWMCGGKTGHLPICINEGSWLSADEIVSRVEPLDTVIIIDHFTLDYELRILDSYTLNQNVFVSRVSGIPGLLQSRSVEWPRERNTNYIRSSGSLSYMLGYEVIQSVAKAWNISLEELSKENDFEREIDVNIGTADGRNIKVKAIQIHKSKVKTS